MRIFKDRLDREWQIEINVSAIKRVKSLIAVDLLAVFDDEMALLKRFFRDPVLLVDTLFCLVKPQADAAEISDESFGQGFSGDALEAGSQALFEEFADFFQNPQQRELLRDLLRKSREMTNELLGMASQRLEKIDPAQQARIYIEKSGGWPELLESTPAPTPSAN